MSSAIGRMRLTGPVSVAVLAALLAGVPVAAFAQADDARLRKIEAEISALQRKVFPGGDERFFKPEISSAPAATPLTGQPTTSATTDMLRRMDSIEAQLAKLTGQVEENSNRIRVLEMKTGAAAPASASEVAGPPAPGSAALPATSPAPAPAPAPQSNLNAMTGGQSAPKPVAASQPVPASSSRVAAVKAIVKPQTNDPGDDDYSYGFRLWDAKFYPEAEQQLKIFIDKYPRHARISWARNLLGRAYLDDGQPREAAKWFLQNYQADKSGARAPDSLLYLAQAMKQLKDTKRACIALAEFSEKYPAEAVGRLRGTYDDTRQGLSCAN